ncbi:MAG: hypothetical protein WAL38_23590 [Solirubrobacteraceae bacterium]
MAGPTGPLGDAPDRVVQLAIGLARLLRGSLAQHERAVLAPRQLPYLPQPPRRVLHLRRTPRPGDGID